MGRTPPHIVAQRRQWYGTQRWKRVRKRVLASCPICAICGIAPATQADHIEHLPDNSTFWSWENLRGACQPCNLHERDRARSQKLGEGYVEGRAWGCATTHGATKTHTEHFKPDRAAEIFNRFKKGASNA
ncbi:hypothetical protein SuNHUV7_22350 (plasmid) [Pseudoseohaeicola sp. NH-UV-7]